MMSLSSTEKEMDSPCVPSRRVVSKVSIFIEGSFENTLVKKHVSEKQISEKQISKNVLQVDRPGGLSYYATGTPTSFFFLRKGII